MKTINLFEYFLRAIKGQSERTIKTNLKLIRRIREECNPLDIKTIGIFLNTLLEKRASPSYIKQNVSIIRQWGECFKIAALAEYPYPSIKYRSTFSRGILSDEEVLAFLNLPNPYPHGQFHSYHDRYERWILFFAILFYHGMRTREIAMLEVDQIDFGLNAIIIPPEKSKIGMRREIPISPALREKLYIYVNGISGTWLFPSITKNALQPHVEQNEWQRFFKMQTGRLGIKRANLTSYSGRHTYGSRQVSQDVNLFKIKEMMGHSRIETTMKYLHTNLSDLQKIQDNDRLLIRDKKGMEILEDIERKQEEVYKPYKDKVTKSVIWDNDELIVKFKLKKS